MCIEYCVLQQDMMVQSPGPTVVHGEDAVAVEGDGVHNGLWLLLRRIRPCSGSRRARLRLRGLTAQRSRRALERPWTAAGAGLRRLQNAFTCPVIRGNTNGA